MRGVPPSEGEPLHTRPLFPGRAGAGGGSRDLGVDRGVDGSRFPLGDPAGSGGGGSRGRRGGAR